MHSFVFLVISLLWYQIDCFSLMSYLSMSLKLLNVFFYCRKKITNRIVFWSKTLLPNMTFRAISVFVWQCLTFSVKLEGIMIYWKTNNTGNKGQNTHLNCCGFSVVISCGWAKSHHTKTHVLRRNFSHARIQSTQIQNALNQPQKAGSNAGKFSKVLIVSGRQYPGPK